MAHGFSFVGKMPSRSAAEDYRLREGLGVQDVHVREYPDGSVELSVRISGIEGNERLEVEQHNKRRW